MKTKQLIIIGGGASIKEGIQKGLWDEIKDHFVIGLNYSYKYFSNPTVQCYVDRDFYIKELPNGLANIPLIVGKTLKGTPQVIKPNTIFLKASNKYTRDLSTGVYKSALVGYFALSLGIYLLDEGDIFLLGYDFGGQGTQKISNNKSIAVTHFYQGEIKHRGIGKVNYYLQKKRPESDFAPYKNEKKIKIYNVSINSRIPDSIFPKISYDQFFKLLDTTTSNQDLLRSYIREQLEKVKPNEKKKNNIKR